MLTIEFKNCGEVRMGSPFNVCELVLSGDWVPDLPTTDWQDLVSISSDGRYVALVRWYTPNNQPGFRVFTIDLRDRMVKKTRRIKGCCEAMWWEDNRFKWSTFSLP